MKISYNWLHDYIEGLPSPEETAAILTGIGLEVESLEKWESVKGGLKGIVTGEVISCEKHPNADKLSLTTVDTGDGIPVPIVCGAPNVKAGQKVVVATVGTVLYKGKESFTIQKTKIRGEVSEGMICAEDELGLGDDHSGIMVLDPSTKPGTPASEYFGVTEDYIFEIGLTPNRIDSASHYGVARDLAAYLGNTKKPVLKRPEVTAFKTDAASARVEVRIDDTTGCRRYSGLTITGLKVKASPAWLQTRLKAIGLNPINNVVDITNFVLHETGQPLHAFDLSKVKGEKVIVKTLSEGTPFLCLDGQTRNLSGEDLMICNASEGMCIAGVFGGADSGVTEETTAIFLESACFNPVYVRKTSRRHLLFTDSAFRFERGSDPEITVYALKRAALLIKELAGAAAVSEIIDLYPVKKDPVRVRLEFAYMDTLIGKKLDHSTVKKILNSLDIRIAEEDAQGLSLVIPSYRVEVYHPADVVEEILRIYGYNNIEISAHVASSLSYQPRPDREKILNLISEMLTASGFNEIMNNSLTKSGYYEGDGNPDPELVRIYNPLSSDLNAMRRSLIFGGLESIQYNTNRRNPDLKLYEFGNIYHRKPHPEGTLKGVDAYVEQARLSIFTCGEAHPSNWNSPVKKVNFFHLKAYVELVLERLGLKAGELESKPADHAYLQPGVLLAKNGIEIVRYGSVKTDLLTSFDLESEVFWADFNWDYLMELQAGRLTRFNPLPRFPEVKRDLSLLIDKNLSFEKIREVSLKAERKLIVSINLFDVYEGDKIEKDKKSYAVSYILQDQEQTLTDKQIEKVMEKIRLALEKETGARVRS
jgi:phenylalanyl-tRNA synthetase beta chain